MKYRQILLCSALLVSALTSPPLQSAPLGTAFAYQGRLEQNGQLATNGAYVLMFELWDAATAGNFLGTNIMNVPVSNGLFAVELNFGASTFTGDARWLVLGVSTNPPGGGFARLAPRIPLLATPNALYATSAGTAGTVANGAISTVHLAANAVNTTVLQDNAVTAPKIASGQVVKSMNGLRDNVALVAGANIALATNGNNLTISGSALVKSLNGLRDDVILAAGANVALATNGNILTFSATGGGGGSGWSLTGNAAAAGNFLGTLNGVPLEFRVNNSRVLRLESTTTSPNLLGGFVGNYFGSGVEGAFIGGGGAATLGGNSATNRVLDLFGTIGGGASNTVGTVGAIGDVAYGFVGGGYGNTASGHAATIGGGAYNQATGDTGPVIAGGWHNLASGSSSAIAGGSTSSAIGPASFIGGGYRNVTSGDSSAILGGRENGASGFAACVGGGELNSAEGSRSVIAGGYVNRVTGVNAAIGGGDSHEAFGDNSTIAGGIGNHTEAFASTVGGGRFNRATTNFTTVAGGNTNWALAPFDTIGGGGGNRALLPSAGALSGGNTIAGGFRNIAFDHIRGAIGGGEGNSLVGLNGVLGPGYCGTVPGGFGNAAGGNYSFAAGRNAKAYHNSSFVWSDGSLAFQSANVNTFNALATGGFEFYTGAGVGARLAAGSGSWSAFSDRRAKENVQPVEGRDVLKKVAALPISLWNYKAQPATVRHIGPMAQDFHAAFGLGESNTHIATVDADGVALAAIQGLNEVVAEKEAHIAKLEAEIAALKKQMAAQEQTLARWNTRFTALEQAAARLSQPATAPAPIQSRSGTSAE